MTRRIDDVINQRENYRRMLSAAHENAQTTMLACAKNAADEQDYIAYVVLPASSFTRWCRKMAYASGPAPTIAGFYGEPWDKHAWRFVLPGVNLLETMECAQAGANAMYRTFAEYFIKGMIVCCERHGECDQ